MRALTSALTSARPVRAARIIAAGAVLAAGAALAGPASPAGASATAAAATAGPAAVAGAGLGPGCRYSYRAPGSWVIVCQSGGSVPGQPGSPGGGGGGGGGGTSLSCTLVPLSPAQISYLGLPAAPKGEEWAAITCPGTQPFGGVTLESKGGGGAPPVTPQELLQVAEGELTVPALAPETAPPPHADGLVGLPELFWIPPGEWHAVTATPEQISLEPGGGLTGTSCDGPGLAGTAAQQAGRSDPCSYTYTESSALQPGGAYAAAVVVTWRVSWTGSGGVGGMLNAGLQVPYPLRLRVAEGQALVTGQ